MSRKPNPVHEQIHATCIAVNDIGVLLLGDAGAGKSDLALRLIDEGAMLIADDRVDLTAEADGLTATAPKALAGKIEVRGIGIVPLDGRNVCDRAPVRVAVRLVGADAVPRMPEAETIIWAGISVPLYRIAPFQASSTAKIRMMANGALRGILPLP